MIYIFNTFDKYVFFLKNFYNKVNEISTYYFTIDLIFPLKVRPPKYGFILAIFGPESTQSASDYDLFLFI